MKNRTEKQQLRAWAKTWMRAGRALEKVKRQELRSYSYAKNRAAVSAMVQWACEHAEKRLTSRLVDQQRYFKKLRRICET